MTRALIRDGAFSNCRSQSGTFSIGDGGRVAEFWLWVVSGICIAWGELRYYGLILWMGLVYYKVI